MKTIEIRKAGFTNKGAAMMLIAATREVNKRIPNGRVVVAANYTTPFQERAALGLWHRAELKKLGFDFGRLIEVVPPKIRQRYGFVTETEIDVVFDAAGFAYSDQWGPRPTEELACRAATWKKNGKKVILLPQAFGPFSRPGMKEAIRRVADCVDLVFARDQQSYKFLTEAVGVRENIQIAPDFTNLLAGIPATSIKRGSRAIAVVPNARMIDMVDRRRSGDYELFLAGVVRVLRASDLKPFFLIHETTEDLQVAIRVNAQLRDQVEIVEVDDPLLAKGIIAECDGMVGSRFHALVSALSQAVPVLGTGWSHKYQELFNEYDHRDGLILVTTDETKIAEFMRPLLTDDARASLSLKLDNAAVRLKATVSEMWASVFDVVEAS